MKFRVQLVIERDTGTQGVVEEISIFQRGQLRAENLGLTLAEARELLRGLQQAVHSARGKASISMRLCFELRLAS